MIRFRRAGVAVAALTSLAASAPSPDLDPVAAARAQRAAAQGVSEDDLPAVPRAIIEPPPLPPPEIHPKDLRGGRGARRAKGAASKKAAATKKAAPAKKSPARKGTRKAPAKKAK